MGMFATRDEASARLMICFACPELAESVPRRCRMCSCYMRAKVQLRNAGCPLQKWGAGAFTALAVGDPAEYWREENRIIERDMAAVAPEDAEYALSTAWPSEGR